MRKIEEGLWKIIILVDTHRMTNKRNKEIMKMASMSHKCMKKNTKAATCILVDHYFHHFIKTYIFSIFDQRDDFVFD